MPTIPRFVQIHALTSYPGALLNRDDVGFAKRLPFGGATRTRISSQCLKRHWRTSDASGALSEIVAKDGSKVEMSLRSRRSFQVEVVAPLVEEGLDQAKVHEATEKLMTKVLGQSSKAEKAKSEAKSEAEAGGKPDGKKPKGKGKVDDSGVPELTTGQVTVLGRPELRYCKELVRGVVKSGASDIAKAVDDALKDAKKNIDAMKRASGLDAALFGRMVTSSILARGDAAVHVAHAFTVHREAAESDYFSAVDDLLGEGDDAKLGSGHIGSVELTSGLYYTYVVVDVPLLVSNLEGCDRKSWLSADRTLAAEVVSRLLKIIATVSPGAKVGSTAPYAYAEAMLVEVGDSQPRTLANAFRDAVEPGSRGLMGNTLTALEGFLTSHDAAYGKNEGRRLMAIAAEPSLRGVVDGRANLAELASWVGDAIRGG